LLFPSFQLDLPSAKCYYYESIALGLRGQTFYHSKKLVCKVYGNSVIKNKFSHGKYYTCAPKLAGIGKAWFFIMTLNEKALKLYEEWNGKLIL